MHCRPVLSNLYMKLDSCRFLFYLDSKQGVSSYENNVFMRRNVFIAFAFSTI